MQGIWGAYIQNGNLENLERCGKALNLKLGCPVHYPAFDKRLFECKHDITFPVWMVEAALMNNDWSMVMEKHNEGK